MSSEILVVDDEEAISGLVAVYLRSEGFSVYTCATAADALARLEEQPPDLAILDIMLPAGMIGNLVYFFFQQMKRRL